MIVISMIEKVESGSGSFVYEVHVLCVTMLHCPTNYASLGIFICNVAECLAKPQMQIQPDPHD